MIYLSFQLHRTINSFAYILVICNIILQWPIFRTLKSAGLTFWCQKWDGPSKEIFVLDIFEIVFLGI